MAITSSATVFAIIPGSLKAIRGTFLRTGEFRTAIGDVLSGVDIEAIRFYSSDYVMAGAMAGAFAIGRTATVSAALLTGYAGAEWRLHNATLDELAAHSAFGKTLNVEAVRSFYAVEGQKAA